MFVQIFAEKFAKKLAQIFYGSYLLFSVEILDIFMIRVTTYAAFFNTNTVSII